MPSVFSLFSVFSMPSKATLRFISLFGASVSCFLLLATTVRAHDFWIEPENFTPTATEAVAISLREGVKFKGNTLPYIDEWFRDFSMTTAAGREPIISVLGDDPAASIQLEAGQALLGYQSVRSFVELDAEKFNNYLEHEGIEFIREERRRRGEDNDPAPEYFVRCAKALLQSDVEGKSVYAKELGYTLELIPLDDPYLLIHGDTLGFQLLYRGEPAEGLLVQAFTREQPDAIQKVRTNAAGRAEVLLSRPGTWFIKAVQIQPIMGDPKALWQSYWASYLFTVE
jgi:uncharacterized GH25 family protein